MSGARYTKPMVKRGKPSRPTMKQQLKALDAITFDELTDLLAETVHTAFRKGAEGADAHSVWSHMRQMPRDEWSAAINWMIWALRVSTGREKKS